MPMLPGSGEKAELGPVSLVEPVVVQDDCAPLMEVVQPAGSPGAFTPSKFCEKRLETAPRGSVNDTLPRFWAPSCNWKVGEMLVPHEPATVKLKAREIAAP